MASKHGTASRYVQGCRCDFCRKAKTEHHRNWRQDKKDKLAADKRQIRVMSASSIKNNRLKRLYGIELADYNQMLEKQDGKCAICRSDKKTRSLAVDHNHITGKVRALLCGGCNGQLGWYETYKHSVDSYLQEHSGLL